jgi:hypothetical protein
MISTQIARASAALLLLGGLALLFASDVILPRIVPTFPGTGAPYPPRSWRRGHRTMAADPFQRQPLFVYRAA